MSLIPLIDENTECLGSINLARCSSGVKLRSGWEEEANGVRQQKVLLWCMQGWGEGMVYTFTNGNSLFKRYPFKK